MTELRGERNPFLRYRTRLSSYGRVTSGEMTDARFVDTVSGLDAAVARVWGHGFVVSPLVDGSRLADAAGLACRLSIKVEARGVGGSHKARHLFGVAIHQAVAETLGAPTIARLAIASCGNAALGAAVIARAIDRPLDVFVPTWADETIVRELVSLGATVQRCERRPDEAGDPSYLRFREAVAAGATPFSVQGTDTPTTFDGARTIGWEISEQAPDVAALYIQVGGGALATSVSLALPDPRLYPVQSEGCAPLQRAWERLAPGFDFEAAAVDPNSYMTPWPDPHSLATGILDDITYDWLPLLCRTRASGGHPIVAPEDQVRRAYALAHEATDIDVCATGTAGLAGLLTEPAPANEHVVVLFTGIDRA